MGILSALLLGLIVGTIATTILRGREPGRLMETLVVGVVGAVVGGLAAIALGIGAIARLFAPGTWALAIVSALLFLFLDSEIGRRGTHREPIRDP